LLPVTAWQKNMAKKRTYYMSFLFFLFFLGSMLNNGLFAIRWILAPEHLEIEHHGTLLLLSCETVAFFGKLPFAGQSRPVWRTWVQVVWKIPQQ
jgi:hypothetical protein